MFAIHPIASHGIIFEHVLIFGLSLSDDSCPSLLDQPIKFTCLASSYQSVCPKNMGRLRLKMSLYLQAQLSAAAGYRQVLLIPQ